MAPQAVRMTSGRRRLSRRLPPLTYLVLLAAICLLIVLGRLLLPLAILFSVGFAAALWFAPEVAFWLDDLLWLQRLPGFGQDNRQIAVASFAYLTTAALAGSVLLGVLLQSIERAAAPAQVVAVGSKQTPAMELAIEPSTLPLPTPPPLPSPDPSPFLSPQAVPSPTVETTSPARVEPRTAPTTDQAPPALRPTFTPASRPSMAPTVLATEAAAVNPTGPALAPKPTTAPNAGVRPPAAQPAAPQASSGDDLVAEIAGVSTAVSPGGRAALSARATPGATCSLSVAYANSGGGGVGSQIAGDDGLCSFSWSVPASTQSGFGNATLTVSKSGKSQTRRVSFTVN